jgi:hypothetical protein
VGEEDRVPVFQRCDELLQCLEEYQIL